jgi:lipopolysaccharide heptosyltransferase I
MSRILLVKTSSMGDIVHALPVVADIHAARPGAEVHWLVEEAYSAVPRMHPGVSRVIVVAFRRWRGRLFRRDTWREIEAYRHELREPHDFVIDAQGLTKSALLALPARGLRCGYAWGSGRDDFATMFYQRRLEVSLGIHAVERNRQLVAGAMGYSLPATLDYGIRAPTLERAPGPGNAAARPYAVLLHATSRPEKLWPEERWTALGAHLEQQGIRPLLPWGGADERARSERLAAAIPDASVPPPLSLEALAALLGGAHAVIGVDTGLTHLAVALGRPTVGLYCATEPGLNGVYGSATAINLGGMGTPPTVAKVVENLARIAPP